MRPLLITFFHPSQRPPVRFNSTASRTFFLHFTNQGVDNALDNDLLYNRSMILTAGPFSMLI